MTGLRFLLECALVAVTTGVIASCAVAVFHRLTARWTQRWAPSIRADLFLLGTLFPGAASIAVTAAAAVPSLLARLGLQADHCGTHLHHPHMCLLHPFDVSSARILLGAVACGLLAYQTLRLALDLLAGRRAVRELEAMGRKTDGRRFPVVRVPGGPNLCHAVGLSSRRVLLSETLAQAVSQEDLLAALAHEEAHHERLDSWAALLVRFSAVFYPPVVMSGLVALHRSASEEAADARAARELGDARAVARAIVSIAQAQISAPSLPSLPNGITGARIEARVLRLLEGPSDRRSVGLVGTLAVFGMLVASSLFAADPIHHGVETLLHLL